MKKSSHFIDPAEMMAYLDGELTPGKASAAADHLERCAECQSLAYDLRSVSQSMLAWEVEASEAVAPPPVVAGKRRWTIRPWMWGLVTAGVVAVLVVGIRVSSVRLPMMRPEGDLASAPLPTLIAEPTLLPSAPMIARTAELYLTTGEFDHALPAIDTILDHHHSYLGSLNISTATGAPHTLNATIRVPAAELVPALDELKKLGRVESEQQTGEEVTGQYIDLEARLNNARNTERRLTGILRERTGKLSDVLDVEKEIDRVRDEIERMDGEKKALAKRVDFATVNLTVAEAGSARGRLGGAIAEGWRTMVASIVAVSLLIASAGPTLLLWGAILFFPLRYAWKRLRQALRQPT